jgi:phenylalanyl-tRNA synthetase alpha chain
MIEKMKKQFEEYKEKIENSSSEADVLGLKGQVMGKGSAIAEAMKSMKTLSIEEKKVIGPYANKVKQDIFSLIQGKLEELEWTKINEKLAKNKIDISNLESFATDTAPIGSFHPVNIVQDKIEDIFLSMGFEVLDGPHIEDEFHNFEALNIPADHPARDMQDTFWLKEKNNQKRLLRTHTSTIQVRGMLEREAPFRFIAPGKVFRCERTDASHEMVFHQLEGMYVDKNVTVGNLIYFMKTLLSEIFEKDVEVRLRPGFFPFVEPGFELDIKCLICSGKGCSVCKQVGWVELLPCGMVHPNVLRSGGVDPDKYNGFAFGLGLDRLVMMKYGIDDVRHIHSGDLRFLQQFVNQ